jgi:hypothetical protein
MIAGAAGIGIFISFVGLKDSQVAALTGCFTCYLALLVTSLCW